MLTEPQLPSGCVLNSKRWDTIAKIAIPNEKGVLFLSPYLGQWGGYDAWNNGGHLATVKQQVQSLAIEGGRGKGLNSWWRCWATKLILTLPSPDFLLSTIYYLLTSLKSGCISQSMTFLHLVDYNLRFKVIYKYYMFYWF